MSLIALKTQLDADLLKAAEQRRRIRKQVEAGASHSSRLDFADGLVAGIESAIALLTQIMRDENADRESSERGMNRRYGEIRSQ